VRLAGSRLAIHWRRGQALLRQSAEIIREMAGCRELLYTL